MSDPHLCSGPITHQRRRADGTWEETPGWMSVDPAGNVILSVLSDEEAAIAEQFADCFNHTPSNRAGVSPP